MMEYWKNGILNLWNPEVPGGSLFLRLCAFMVLFLWLVCAAGLDARADLAPPIVPLPSGLIPQGAPETFGPDTLYEKINGQATLYLSAGFVRLKSQWFEDKEDSDLLFEVSIYDMGTGSNAFSVYSSQRREGARPVDLTRFAYQTENALYLVHGPYYVEIMSTESSEKSGPSGKAAARLRMLAERFMEDNPVDEKSIAGLELFPEKHLIPDSIAMIPMNAFGFERLDRVFTARYALNGDQITAFVSRRKTHTEARDLVSGFHAYLMAYGGKNIESHTAVEGTKTMEVMDTYIVLFPIGPYLAGIYEAPTKKQAEWLAGELARFLGSTL
jgi:hypothetical protein